MSSDDHQDHQGNPWTTLRQSVEFDSPYFGVRVDTVQYGEREPRPYNSIRAKLHGVVVVPVDDEGCTVLVGQYRYVLGRYSWETPGGGAPAALPALPTAQAELGEETGWRAEHWLQVLSAAICPGLSDEVSPGFVAWGISQGAPHPDPEEHLARRRLPFGEAVAMALRGEIGHMSGIALLLGIEARLRRGDLPADLMALLRRGGS